MAKPEDLSFLTPWEEIPDESEGQNRAEQLLGELRREIPSNHPLGGLTLNPWWRENRYTLLEKAKKLGRQQ